MSAREIIEKKRDGLELSPEELIFLLNGYTQGEVTDYQISAWLMAVYLRGMSENELAELTRIMRDSGKILPRAHRRDFWIDKHSTGGVGDKTSLLLVPLVITVAEYYLGHGIVKIPMVSGRGLGHTGGTIDKLESVPGFSANVPLSKAVQRLEQNGFSMLGQTDEIAPLDRSLYALRDVTGTVESIPLIVSSILSKKLAENLDGLVFDVKVGKGAFMTTEVQAMKLAEALVKTAKAHGLKACALLTDMSEPLGKTIGHFIEVEECFDFATGKKQDERLKDLVLELSARMVYLASREEFSLSKAKEICASSLKAPDFLKRFQALFKSQGGDLDAFEKERTSWRARSLCYHLESPGKGYVSQLDPRQLGNLLVNLGGGRIQKTDPIDPFVGIDLHKRVGDFVEEGEPVLDVFYPKENHCKIQQTLEMALKISNAPVPRPPLILQVLE